MKYIEFASTQAPQTYVVQPDQFKRNRIRNNIATNIAKDRARPQPTADDLAIGFARYCQVQRQADLNYEKSRRSAAKRAESKVVPEGNNAVQIISQVQESADYLHVYTAVIRVKVAGSTSSIRTQILADGLAQARKLLQHLYGVDNVMALVAVGHHSHSSKVS